MASSGSVSKWIPGVRSGCPSSTAAIWDRFRPGLLAVARKRYGGSCTAAADEEDAVLSAFHSFIRRTSSGSFTDLANRDDLWNLLVSMTVRKVLQQIRGQHAQKRGGGVSQVPVSLVELAAAAPTPEFVASMNDAVAFLISVLDDVELEQIVIMRLEGYTNQEIAIQIGRSVPTVERRVKLIRETWQNEVEK